MNHTRSGICFLVFLLCSVAALVAGWAQAPAAPSSPSEQVANAPLAPEELAARKDLLSTRVTELYKLTQIPAWRKVEAYLTEDSKDIFFEQNKGPIVDFTVKILEVQPDGRVAVAHVEIKFNVPRFPSPFILVQKTRWVWEQNNWFLKLERSPAANPLTAFQLNQPSEVYKNAVLRFEKLEQEIARGSHEYVFPFHNAGKEALSVRLFADECNCMDAKLDKENYAPGESGQLRVRMQLDDKALPRDYFVRLYATPGGHWVITKLKLRETSSK